MNIFKLFARKPQPQPAKKGLRCTECGERIRKHDLHTVVQVRHKDCANPSGAGTPKALVDYLDGGM